jgi:hypothetical protein
MDTAPHWVQEGGKMSDAISKAIEAMVIARSIVRTVPFNVAATKELTEAIDALQALQSGEPVAVRYGFDGYGYLYLDGGSGSDWMTRIADAEKLYTRPPAWLTQEPVAYWNKDHVFASFIKLADDLEYEEGDPPDGWVPLYFHPQPSLDVFAFDELVKQAAGQADMYLENDEVTILEFGRILHGLLSADKR